MSEATLGHVHLYQCQNLRICFLKASIGSNPTDVSTKVTTIDRDEDMCHSSEWLGPGGNETYCGARSRKINTSRKKQQNAGRRDFANFSILFAFIDR